MRRIFATGIVAAGTLAAGGAPEEPPRVSIAIRVYNYAAVAAGDLLQAKERALQVFHHAGVDADFVDCPLSPAEVERYPGCAPGRRPVEFVLRLHPGYPPREMAGSSISGFALTDAQGFGTFASVFTAGAEALAQGSRRLGAAILGCLVAHEIGHLLLGTSAHAAAGVMRSGWGRAEMEHAAQGNLRFTREEARRMRSHWLDYARQSR